MSDSRFRVLYSDIGGVLATNGWDTNLRRRLCAHFDLDREEVERRHGLMFDSYERGFMSLEDYLAYVIFWTERPFTLDAIREFTYSQSIPWVENIEFFRQLKTRNSLKLALISNEGAGITEYRVEKFKLRELADFLVISNFVRFRKPDTDIWKLALNLAGAAPSESIYIDDRELFANVAASIGFTTIHHTSLLKTRKRLQELGLDVGEELAE